MDDRGNLRVGEGKLTVIGLNWIVSRILLVKRWRLQDSISNHLLPMPPPASSLPYSLLDSIAPLPFFHRHEVLNLALPLHLQHFDLAVHLVGNRAVTRWAFAPSGYRLDVLQCFPRVRRVGNDKGETECGIDHRKDDSDDDLQVVTVDFARVEVKVVRGLEKK